MLCPSPCISRRCAATPKERKKFNGENNNNNNNRSHPTFSTCPAFILMLMVLAKCLRERTQSARFLLAAFAPSPPFCSSVGVLSLVPISPSGSSSSSHISMAFSSQLSTSSSNVLERPCAVSAARIPSSWPPTPSPSSRSSGSSPATALYRRCRLRSSILWWYHEQRPSPAKLPTMLAMMSLGSKVRPFGRKPWRNSEPTPKAKVHTPRVKLSVRRRLVSITQ